MRRVVCVFAATVLFAALAGLRADAATLIRGFMSPRPPLLAGETPWHASWANSQNRNLYRLAVCETGGINAGRPLWTHHNETYAGALGFRHSTWQQYRHRVRPLPPTVASRATPAEQYAVGRALIREFGGYSSWPECHNRLGLPA